MNIAEKNNNEFKTQYIRRKSEYRRYRSGSSSDSAINLENTLEDNTNLMILKESSDVFDDFNKMAYNFACLASQKQVSFDSIVFKRVLSVMKKYYSAFDSDDPFDKFGFIRKTNEKTNEDCCYAEYLIGEILNANSSKHWTDSCQSIKCLIRDYGIPNSLRPQIWLIFIKSKICDNIDVKEILSQMSDRNESESNSDNENSVFRQIDLDIHRTFPNHKMFVKDGDGISKLRNILICYCIGVNPKVGYCQGMNFIGALLLIIFEGNEEYSLMGLIAIIDHYFPPHYYDHHLTGARADQMLLKDLIIEMTSNLKIQTHLNDQMLEEITNALSLNWFLSLYHSSLPWQVRLNAIDCFLLEGVKVLFRFSLALIKIAFDTIDQEQIMNSGDLINKIRETSQNCYDLFELKRIAFNEIQIPKRKYMASKRAFYAKQIISRSQLTLKTDIKETASQWIRRRSSELLGIRPNICEHKIVISSDASKAVAFRRNSKNITQISILCTQSRENIHKSEWNLKSPLIIGISNNGNRIICTQSSSKTVTKYKDNIQIDFIGIDFEPFDGFFLEELESVVIINNRGLIFKCKLDSKQSESTIILNNKNLNIISADLNRNYGLIWLNTVSKDNITHKFISFDIKSLDIYTVIESDFFNIEKFYINSMDKQSVIEVKCEPINGKLKKTLDIITKYSQKQKIFDFYDEIFDIKCFSFDEQIKDFSLDFNYNLVNEVVNDSCEQTDDKCLLIILTKNSSNIYIEYKFNNFLRKKVIFIDQIKDISEINEIKIVKMTKKGNTCQVTLLIYSVDTFFFVIDLNINS